MKPQFLDNMEIRPFVEDDRYEVATLVRQVLEEYGLLSDPGSLTSEIAKLSKRYEAGGAGFWVLLEDGKVVGTVGIRPLGEFTAEIEKLYLSTRTRGKGFGRALLNFVEDQAKKEGFRRLFISCPKKFEKSKNFFQLAQYRLVGNAESQTENLFEKEMF